MKTYKHTKELFKDSDHRITKSHCFLCHHALTPNKKVRGNACHECDHRASLVSRYKITEEDSDLMLRFRTTELSVETWNIDGEDYYKYPNGKLCKK